MRRRLIRLTFRSLLVSALLSSLTGCVWWRLYQVYNQMAEFDEHFSVQHDQSFTLFFKDPVVYSEDFVFLAKLQPTQKGVHQGVHRWDYFFQKVDQNNQSVNPPIAFTWTLFFNADNRLEAAELSPIFLKIVPPAFLEASIRSIAGAAINATERQLKADVAKMAQITVPLPTKNSILAVLGAPIGREKSPAGEVLSFRFLLVSPDIEPGYESRAMSTVKLTFDPNTERLSRMSGRYAGLKIAINYQNLTAL